MKRLGALAKIERPSERVLRKIHGDVYWHDVPHPCGKKNAPHPPQEA